MGSNGMPHLFLVLSPEGCNTTIAWEGRSESVLGSNPFQCTLLVRDEAIVGEVEAVEIQGVAEGFAGGIYLRLGDPAHAFSIPAETAAFAEVVKGFCLEVCTYLFAACWGTACPYISGDYVFHHAVLPAEAGCPM